MEKRRSTLTPRRSSTPQAGVQRRKSTGTAPAAGTTPRRKSAASPTPTTSNPYRRAAQAAGESQLDSGREGRRRRRASEKVDVVPTASDSEPDVVDHGAAERQEAEATLKAEREREEAEVQTAIAARTAELSAVQRELSAIAFVAKRGRLEEQTKRLAQRTAELEGANKDMRKEIDTLRNADRVTVSLRDTLETLKKHQRMRVAHIRQKEATIELMATRTEEQRLQRRQVVASFEETVAEILTACDEFVAREQSVEHIDPFLGLEAVTRIAALEEAFVSAAAADVRSLHAANDAAAHHLRDLALDLRVERGGEETAADTEAQTVAEEWAHTKRHMLAELQHCHALADETHFHLRRGTNVKGLEQLPISSPEALAQRELGLLLAADTAHVATLRERLSAHRSKTESLRTVRGGEVDARRSMAASLRQALAAARAENDRRRGEYASLVPRTVVAPSPPAIADRPPEGATPPKRFTDGTLRRLLTPTRSRRAADVAAAEEREVQRATTDGWRGLRPSRAAPSPTRPSRAR